MTDRSRFISPATGDDSSSLPFPPMPFFPFDEDLPCMDRTPSRLGRKNAVAAPTLNYEGCTRPDQVWLRSAIHHLGLRAYRYQTHFNDEYRPLLKNLVSGWIRIQPGVKELTPDQISVLLDDAARRRDAALRHGARSRSLLLRTIAALPEGIEREFFGDLVVASLHDENLHADRLIRDLYPDYRDQIARQVLIHRFVSSGHLQVRPRLDTAISLPSALKHALWETHATPRKRLTRFTATSVSSRVRVRGRQRRDRKRLLVAGASRTVAKMRAELVRRIAGLAPHHLQLLSTVGGYLVGERARPVLLVGATGSGKTHLVRSLAAAARLPFDRLDLSRFTANGYQGPSLCDVLDRDPADTRRRIVLLDEVDKIASRSGYTNHRDIRGTELQNELLSYLESETRRPELFILAGAFSRGRGVEDLGARGPRIGFTAGAVSEDNTGVLSSISAPGEERIVSWLDECGILPELLGRIGVVVTLPAPGVGELRALLDHPASPLKAMRTRFRMAGIRLRVTPEGKDALAARAAALNLGMRGIANVLELVLGRAMSSGVRELDLARALISAHEAGLCAAGPRVIRAGDS